MELPLDFQRALHKRISLLQQQGPLLGRPFADTLRDSRHSNMKELRFRSMRAVWRVAFAFDPHRQAILLLGWNKKGENERLFYEWLISEADRRFDEHLRQLEH